MYYSGKNDLTLSDYTQLGYRGFHDAIVSFSTYWHARSHPVQSIFDAGIRPFNMLNIYILQVVYLQYNGLDPVTNTLGMKIYPIILLLLQLMELSCYINLYNYIRSHDQRLVNDKVISHDKYQSRSRLHSISIVAQFLGFIVEIIYNILHFLIKLLGQKLFLPDIVDYSNIFKMTEFGVVTTIDILATPEMRKKLFSMVGR